MASDIEKDIKAAEAEVERLKAELEKARKNEKDLEETRKAMLYLLEDVNEAKEEITTAKEAWEATFDSISDLLFIHGPDMKIIRCNLAYKLAAGLGFKDIIGRPYYEVFPKMDGPFSVCMNKDNSEGLQNEEEEVPVPSLNRIYKTKFYVVNGHEGAAGSFIHVMEDVTVAKRAEQRFETLYKFGQRIASNLDIDFRLKFICETVAGLGYSLAWIGLPDEATHEVIPRAFAGREEGYLSEIKVMLDDSALAGGPAGRAIKSKGIVIQNMISTDPRFAPWREAALKRGYRSVASFPIMDEDRVIASLTVSSPEDDFPEADVPFLMNLAASASVHIKNASLFKEVMESSERIQSEMELTKNFLKISEATARTTDIDKLMGQVVHSLKDITGCAACVSYLWDAQKKQFIPLQESGLTHEAVPYFRIERLDSSIPSIKKLQETKAPLIQSLEEDRLLCRLLKGLKTAVYVPVVGREDYLGVIICLYSHSPVMEARFLKLLSGISHHVSIALEEARLFNESIDRTMELSRKVDTIQAMSEIDSTILSTLRTEDILETSTMMIGKVVNCDRVVIALTDKERGGFIYTAGFGVASVKKGDLVRFEDTSATDVMRTGRPQYIANAARMKGPLPFETALLNEGFLTSLRVPLNVKGDVVGILSIGARRTSAFTADDLAIIEKLATQVGVALENARLLSDKEELFIGVVKTLSEAIDAKSPWTRGHSERVTKIAIDVGKRLGLGEQELKDLEIAGLLHDIGKLGTYESILDKPGKLTEEEFMLMRQHPGKGADILAPIKQLRHILGAIEYHHEFYDGTGYPKGLKGEDIPFMARILTVADSVDAMGADRPYRKGRSMDDIIKELKRCSGTQFDPRIVEAFLDIIKNIQEPKGEHAVLSN